jgi:thermitase
MLNLRNFLGITGFLCSLTPHLLSQPLEQRSFVPGRLLVRFRDSVPANEARTAIQSVQARSIGEIPGIGVYIVELPPNASEVAFQNAFRQRVDVEFAELDHIRPHQQLQQITPNDPQFGSEWHLPKISAPAAWSVTTGSTGIIIAIADTGVDSSHPDLVAKVVAGWNVNDNNSDTRDVYGHGTKVAGTTAAATNNGLGVASIAWNCWIMPVRVSLTNGSAYDSTIAGGIIWAADHGARVVNVSYKVTGSSTVSSAAKYLYNKGGVVTISAGNYSTFESIPNDPYIITVGATDPSDLLYSFSNTGTAIDLVAPGCVTTTTNGGGYAGACGTSFSAPVVAGVAALVLSANPNLSASQVTNILQSSADDLGSNGWDTTFGFGRVNAARAVGGGGSTGPTVDSQAPTVSFTSPSAGAVLSGTTGIQVSATDNVGVTSITVTANGTVIGSSGTFSWNTTAWSNGSYTLVATAKDAAGNSASTSRVVSVSNSSSTTPTPTPDTTAPTVSITSPQAGAVLAGQTTVTVAARDNIAVVKVTYYCDGVLIGSTTAAPYSLRWNTKKVVSGTHSLQAKAFDAAGNIGSSNVMFVTVR